VCWFSQGHLRNALEEYSRQGAVVVVAVGGRKRKKTGWKCGRHFIARPNLISD